MKHPKLVYGFIAVLGIVFLAIYAVFRIAKEYGLTMATPISDAATLLVPILVGTFFLTVGICGIGMEHFKLSKSKESKVAYAILVLLTAFMGILTLYYIYCSFQLAIAL